MDKQTHILKLPLSILSPSDVYRVRRELAALDDFMHAQTLRQPGVPTQQLPKLSRTLDELTQMNAVNLLHATVRKELAAALDRLRTDVPIVHLAFASEPTPATLQKLVQWFRANIDPYMLVHVGLQPSIVAGCSLRTTNKYFDFSLRHHLEQQRQFLLEALTPQPQQLAAEVAHE